MLKYERGRVQTDGEYKLLILLIYLSRTIKSHMHHAGSYEIQIPTEYGSVTYLDLIAANLQYLDWVNRNTSVDSDHCQCLYHLSFKRADPRHEASWNITCSLRMSCIWHRWCRTIAWPWSHGALDKWQISPTWAGMHKYIGCQTCDKRKQCSHP